MPQAIQYCIDEQTSLVLCCTWNESFQAQHRTNFILIDYPHIGTQLGRPFVATKGPKMPVFIRAIAPHRNFAALHALIFEPLCGVNLLKNRNSTYEIAIAVMKTISDPYKPNR